MATRINVTAVRECSPAEVKAVMAETLRPARTEGACSTEFVLPELPEHKGWVSFTTSVWGVSASDLNRGLCRLARPALQFSTSDGDRWYLTVHGGPRGQVHFLHEFSEHGHDPDPAEDADRQAALLARDEPTPVDPQLAFLEEDPTPVSERAKVPFDLLADSLTGLGAIIPDEFRSSVADLPYSQAAARYRRWHAEQISEALTAAGIPHDAAAVRSVLLWENITDAESSSDLGNLPRLLSTLGLGGEWEEWIRQAEAPPPPPEPEEEASTEAPPAPPPPREDLIGPVLAITDPLGLTPVAGGLVSLPLKDMALVRFFPEALSIYATAGVVLTITLPRGFDRAELNEPDEDAEQLVEVTPDGFRFGLPNHLFFGRRDFKNILGKKLSQLLFHLPDGSVLDVAFALADHPALAQHYRGPVAGEVWQIDATYPPLSRAVLRDALDLASKAGRSKHKTRDEAEALAVIERAKRDPNLWDLTIQRKGQTIWSESDVVGHLPKAIFRQRFAAYWDVAAHDREAVRLNEERLNRERQMRQAGVEAAKRRAAPHDDEVLLEGKLGLYWRSDFAQLTELEQETREKTDAALAGLGFRHVGDIVAKKQRDIVMRTWVSGDRLSYGILMGKRTMYMGYEFFSRFADGSILTTTTNSSVDSRPEFKSYAKTHPGLEPAALYERHQWGVARFRTRKGTEPVPLDESLPSVARELDRGLARREGVALRFRIVSTPPGEPPPEIRAAWVGCVLPLFAMSDDPKVGQQMKGVLSQQPEDYPQGFAVRVADALRALERHNAEAARWWREHAPHLNKPGQPFVYPADNCELVDDIEEDK